MRICINKQLKDRNQPAVKLVGLYSEEVHTSVLPATLAFVIISLSYCKGPWTRPLQQSGEKQKQRQKHENESGFYTKIKCDTFYVYGSV